MTFANPQGPRPRDRPRESSTRPSPKNQVATWDGKCSRSEWAWLRELRRLLPGYSTDVFMGQLCSKSRPGYERHWLESTDKSLIPTAALDLVSNLVNSVHVGATSARAATTKSWPLAAHLADGDRRFGRPFIDCHLWLAIIYQIDFKLDDEDAAYKHNEYGLGPRPLEGTLGASRIPSPELETERRRDGRNGSPPSRSRSRSRDRPFSPRSAARASGGWPVPVTSLRFWPPPEDAQNPLPRGG